MKLIGLTWRKIVLALVVMTILGGAVLWLFLPGIITSQLTAALRDAGFRDASITQVDVYYNATHIQGINLATGKTAIDEIEVYYSPGNLLRGRIDRIFIDRVDLHASYTDDGLILTGLMLETGEQAQQQTDITAALANIPFDELMIRSADLVVDVQEQPVTINFAGRMQRGPSGAHALQGRIRGRSDNADIAAKFEGAIETNGQLQLSLNIDEAALDHPLISTNRLTGWSNLEIGANARPALTAEIAAGVLSLNDTGLRSVTLTYTQQDTAHHFIARGKIADDGGEFIADFDSTPDGDNFNVKASLAVTEGRLERISQLETLSGGPVSGVLNLDLNAACHAVTPFPLAPADCDTISGASAVNLRDFAVDGLLRDAVAKLDFDLSRPQEGGIAITSKSGAEISLIPGENFPSVDLVTGFTGERLTVNLGHDDQSLPHLALLADGNIRAGGSFAVVGQGDNAIEGRVTELIFRPGYAPLPEISASKVRIHASLASINTPALQSDKAVFTFVGDIHLNGDEQSLTFRPSECVLIKAQKLNAALYRPENAFDACIPPTQPAEGEPQPDWLKIWLAPDDENAISIWRTQYNGGLPSLPIDLRLEDDDGPYRVTGTIPKGQVSLLLDADFRPTFVEATFSGGGHLISSKAPFSLTGFDGTVVYRAPDTDKPAQLDTKLDISRFAHGVKRRPYFMPLGLSFESSTDLKTQEMTFSASAMDGMGALVIELAGTHRLTKNSGFGTFKIYPVDFGLIAPPMQDAFPVLRNWIIQATGKLTVDTALSWAKIFDESPVLDGSGTITLEDAALETQDLTAAGIAAEITLDDIWPPTLPPGQTLTVKAADIGIPLTDGEIRFSLTADKILDIEKFDWQLAGGVVKAAPFAIPIDTMEKTIRLQASNIDLAQLAIMAEIEGLEATGTVNGDIPVKVSPQGFDINKGLLRATGNGVIRYNPDEVPPALAGSNEQIITVRDALKNLQYKNLSMEISGGSEGTQQIGLHISGKNPDFYGGHPVELNLNLDGDLGALIRQSLNALGFTDQIVRDTLKNQSENGNAE